MRRNEKTVQAFARLGRADSYAERQLGALWATRWASGQATIGFEHSYRDALSGRDRDFFTADLRSQGGGVLIETLRLSVEAMDLLAT